MWLIIPLCLLPVSVVGELVTALDLSSFCGETEIVSIIIIKERVLSTFMITWDKRRKSFNFPSKLSLEIRIWCKD